MTFATWDRYTAQPIINRAEFARVYGSDVRLWDAMGGQWIARRWEELMSRPVRDPERPRLSDQVRLKPETLATRCKKFLTLGAVYTERQTFAKRRNGPWPCTVKAGPGVVNMAKWPGPGIATCKVGGPVEAWPAPLERGEP